jgi:hypothetical protein
MAGMANYLRNKIIDWYHRGVAFTPPATVYIELCSTAPSASSAGTPLSGTGYARVALTHSTTAMSATNGATTTTNPSSGTSGQSSNNALLDYGTAGAAWGTAAYWESYDSSSGGNRLHYGTITNAAGTPTPRTIETGDPVSFPISAIKFNWS